ncbi:MAG: hypothetical protein QM674_14295 [Burkholderiaceae bacterium]
MFEVLLYLLIGCLHVLIENLTALVFVRQSADAGLGNLADTISIVPSLRNELALRKFAEIQPQCHSIQSVNFFEWHFIVCSSGEVISLPQNAFDERELIDFPKGRMQRPGAIDRCVPRDIRNYGALDRHVGRLLLMCCPFAAPAVEQNPAVDGIASPPQTSQPPIPSIDGVEENRKQASS